MINLKFEAEHWDLRSVNLHHTILYLDSVVVVLDLPRLNLSVNSVFSFKLCLCPTLPNYPWATEKRAPLGLGLFPILIYRAVYPKQPNLI